MNDVQDQNPDPGDDRNGDRWAVQARGLGRRFGRHWALAHVDLDVAPGETLMLAGLNGSGKTTLLRILAGLYRPTRGTLRIMGFDIREDRAAVRRNLSMVSHDSYLYPRLTALETVRVWTRLLGCPAADPEILGLLEEVDLGHRPNTPVGGFSAGMRKRLVLLRTRLEAPRLVLLDEPFSALDTEGQQLVEDWIRDFRAAGKTVILASHSLERASRLCDRAYLLHLGQLAWHGPPGEVLQRIGEVR